jgi:LacI family transcriptional regulator
MSCTIKDIARLAGVSHSTVSRCLNDSPLVSEKTKEKIKKIAEELHFEFNSNARYLSTKKTGTVAVIFPEASNEKFMFSYYLSVMMYDIQAFFEKSSIDCLITTSRNRHTGESNIMKIINKKKVDGLIIVHPDISQDILKKIDHTGIPYVFLHYKPVFKNIENYNYVTTDHFKGGYIATGHLLKNGLKKIITVSIDTHITGDIQFEERTEGYRKALKEFGIRDERIIPGKANFQFGFDLVKNNFDSIKGADAIFAQADVIALGLMKALSEKNIRVPDDISIIGYDDLEIGNIVNPGLTTVHQPVDEQVFYGCSRLIELMGNKNVNNRLQVIFEPKLIVRKSCIANFTE